MALLPNFLLSIVFFFALQGCQSAEDYIRPTMTEDDYKLTLDDGSEIDIRTSPHQGDGPHQYSYGFETSYSLLLLNSPALISMVGNGIPLLKFLQLSPGFEVQNFTAGDTFYAAIAFSGIAASNDGKTNISGSYVVRGPDNKIILEKRNIQMHNSKLAQYFYALGNDPLMFPIDETFKEGTYRIEAPLHDAAFGIDIPLTREFSIISTESLRKKRFGEKYSSGWESPGKPFQLFISQQKNIVDYLSKPQPINSFYDYASKATVQKIIRGENLFAAIAFTNPFVDEYIKKCHVGVTFFFFAPSGKILLELRNGPVCDNENSVPTETKLGSHIMAIEISKNLPTGEYLLVAEVFDANNGSRHELGQKLLIQ